MVSTVQLFLSIPSPDDVIHTKSTVAESTRHSGAHRTEVKAKMKAPTVLPGL